MSVTTLPEALKALGRAPEEPPRRAVIHGPSGSLVTLARLDPEHGIAYVGVWVGREGVRFLGAPPVSSDVSAAHHLKGDTATLFDLFAETARSLLERIEEVDTELATLQQKGRSVALSEVWALQRRIAGLRALGGHAIVAAAECEGPLSGSFPGLADALPPLLAQLRGVQELAGSVQQSLSDLILLRNAEESNRIADAANQLSRTSNRIAALANTSNIRMLGITYIALLLGLVSAVVLIPNTGATILGMPSAGWVPGLWVDAILVVLAVVPLALVFSRGWVLDLLRGLKSSELRTSEGLGDLPELPPEEPLSRTGPVADPPRTPP
ncbi:MAG: hypothetical protein L3K19_06080 [Thermoplasmata archaeon]|nr:hypothetical protein [Thermoplasmata archaeon]